jgi:NAD(P)-dependent dehydrogenase (short-subunit alcohol dehydrogenase family)
VRTLAREGAAVMVADVSAEGCRSLVEEIEVAGGTIDFVAGDVRDRAYCERIVAGTVERFGGGSVAGESIINIGSIEGLGANPHHAAYCASKAGVHGMTRAMAVDLGADNIRCNAIAPGWIASELSETYLESRTDAAAARDALNRLHPVGRVGRPTDVGDLAVYLASDKSSFLTGEVVVLDGGRTAKLPLPS